MIQDTIRNDPEGRRTVVEILVGDSANGLAKAVNEALGEGLDILPNTYHVVNLGTELVHFVWLVRYVEWEQDAEPPR